jgi:hypothetical protein
MFINTIYKVIGQIFITRQPALLQSATTALPPPRHSPAWRLSQGTLPLVREREPEQLLLLVVSMLLGLALAFAGHYYLWLEGANSAMVVQWHSALLLHCALGISASLYTAWTLSKTRGRTLHYLLAQSESLNGQTRCHCLAY